MGLFDKLLDQGAKALKGALENAEVGGEFRSAIQMAREKLDETLGGESPAASGSSAATAASGTAASGTAPGKVYNKAAKPARGIVYESDDRPFEDKLREVLHEAGSYELQVNIPCEQLEREAGREIYRRGGGRCLPEPITYGIYRDGRNVLYIRLWYSYGDYNRAANRAIRRYCDTSGTRMLDFFAYLPNAKEYMQERISAQLA